MSPATDGAGPIGPYADSPKLVKAADRAAHAYWVCVWVRGGYLLLSVGLMSVLGWRGLVSGGDVDIRIGRGWDADVMVDVGMIHVGVVLGLGYLPLTLGLRWWHRNVRRALRSLPREPELPTSGILGTIAAVLGVYVLLITLPALIQQTHGLRYATQAVPARVDSCVRNELGLTCRGSWTVRGQVYYGVIPAAGSQDISHTIWVRVDPDYPQRAHSQHLVRNIVVISLVTLVSTLIGSALAFGWWRNYRHIRDFIENLKREPQDRDHGTAT